MLSPFRGGFWDIQSEFDRMFDEMVGDLFGRRRRGVATATSWAPGLEAYARDGDLVLRADLPGCRIEDVDITLEGNVLTISGERRPVSEEGVSYYLREVPYGAFRRSVTVPEGVDTGDIRARLENGVLEVVLPGAAREVAPKRISIETGEGRVIEGGTAS